MLMLVLVLFMTRYISSSVCPVASTYILVGSCLHYCAVNWLTESDHTPYKASCRESSPTSRRAARRGGDRPTAFIMPRLLMSSIILLQVGMHNVGMTRMWIVHYDLDIIAVHSYKLA